MTQDNNIFITIEFKKTSKECSNTRVKDQLYIEHICAQFKREFQVLSVLTDMNSYWQLAWSSPTDIQNKIIVIHTCVVHVSQALEAIFHINNRNTTNQNGKWNVESDLIDLQIIEQNSEEDEEDDEDDDDDDDNDEEEKEEEKEEDEEEEDEERSYVPSKKKMHHQKNIKTTEAFHRL